MRGDSDKNMSASLTRITRQVSNGPIGLLETFMISAAGEFFCFDEKKTRLFEKLTQYFHRLFTKVS